MRDINDGQLKEVAKMLNVKPTTAHMIQKRALEKFKKEILKHLMMPQQLGVTVPFFQLNTFNYFIEETVEEQPDNIMTVSAQCNCEICFEECENDPIKSAIYQSIR